MRNPGNSTQEIGISNIENLEHSKLTTGLLTLWYGMVTRNFAGEPEWDNLDFRFLIIHFVSI